jgi:hypothetical protein
MICYKCDKEKNESECIVSRLICRKCDRRLRYEKNKDKENEKAKKRYEDKYKNDPDSIQQRKDYHKIRKESGRRSKYSKERYKDNKVKIKDKLRKKIGYCIKSCQAKENKQIEIVGCTIEEFKNYIESKFKPGMTWENHGRNGWHIDHIKPYKCFDLLDLEEQKKCCHYTNLQPLWWHENIKKSDNE